MDAATAGLIGGIVVAVLLLVGVVIAIIVFVSRRLKRGTTNLKHGFAPSSDMKGGPVEPLRVKRSRMSPKVRKKHHVPTGGVSGQYRISAAANGPSTIRTAHLSPQNALLHQQKRGINRLTWEQLQASSVPRSAVISTVSTTSGMSTDLADTRNINVHQGFPSKRPVSKLPVTTETDRDSFRSSFGVDLGQNYSRVQTILREPGPRSMRL